MLGNLKALAPGIKNYYAIYDANWNENPSAPVSMPSAINAKAGSTWVSLSWAPPSKGLNRGNYECGYVVCRSDTAPPQTLDDQGAYIVYVGTGTHFGDMQLSLNSSELRTADMGLKANATYYYSVFVVTTVDPTSENQVGYRSKPLSIAVTTTGITPINLVQNPQFKDVTASGGTNWVVSNATDLQVVASTTTDLGDAFTQKAGESITSYLSVTQNGSLIEISQEIQPNGAGTNLVPGKLYSFSVWFRSNNPLSPAQIAKGGDSSCFPVINLFGGSTSTQINIFQEEQAIANEGPLGAYNQPAAPCSPSDSKTCSRTWSIGGQNIISFAYGNPVWTGLWQRAAATFVIGSTEPSPTTNSYNINNNKGDPVQAPNGADRTETITSFDTFTLQFQISKQESGISDSVIIDIANPTIVEGLIPYTDPFWGIIEENANKDFGNLVYNSSFDGLYTDTAGSVVPFWMFDPLLNPLKMPSPLSQGEAAFLNNTGNAITLLNTSTATFSVPITGGLSCPADDNCVLAANSVGTGMLATATKSITFQVGKADAGESFTADYSSGPVSITFNNTTTSPDYTAIANDWGISIISTSYEGGQLCFSSKTDPRYNGKPIATQCNSFQNWSNTTANSAMVMTACNANGNLTQGNIYGATPPMFGSFMLEANGKYTLTFDCAVPSGVDTTKFILTLNINDIAKGAECSQEITGLTADGEFHSISVTFTPPSMLNPQFQFNLSASGTEEANVAITNVVVTATGGEKYGIQNPYPALATVPYTTQDDVDKHAIVWTFPPKGANSVTNQLFTQTAQRLDGTPLDSSQGMTLLNAYHETCSGVPPTEFVDNKGNKIPAGADLVLDNDESLKSILGITSGEAYVLAITKANSIMLGEKEFFANASSFLQSNAYYGSGRWDLWVKLDSLTRLDGTKFQGPKNVYNPTSTSLAMWIYHALDFGVAGGAPALLYVNTLLNSEIDIEIGGACPDYSQNYGHNIARLNGWGGQWGCSPDCGNNFTMHTMMPANATLNVGISADDGYYHKLSIVYHSGVDFTPDQLDPNGTYPNTRQPGFIKWFIDDVEWGCGWTGNSYGLDYVPMTATRLVFGPEATDWAGSCLCANTAGLCNGCAENLNPMQPSGSMICDPYDKNGVFNNPNYCICGGCLNNAPDDKGYQYVTTGSNPADYGKYDVPNTSFMPKASNADTSAVKAFPNGEPCPTCNDWSTVTYNIAKIQFTPTCIDCPLPGSTDTTYYPDATLPNRPAANGQILPGSNRNRTLPETKPYIVFPPT